MIALTGSQGFLGTTLRQQAAHYHIPVLQLLRGPSPPDLLQADACASKTLGDPGALAECTVVIHAAARAHILHETDPNPLDAFRLANTTATLRLAEAAIAANVRRFVFISSIGVLGNHSSGQPLRPSNHAIPVEDYARSKAEAEDGLRALCERSDMELVIVRPPLVHGPGAKGNFQRLMAAIYVAKRLPLGGVDNRRSFVGVDNLADALLVAATAPLTVLDEVDGAQDTASFATRPTEVGRPGRLKSALRTAAPRTYHIADDGVISTRRLVEVLAEGMGVQPRLINVPRWLAVGGATLLGKGAMARRLLDDLEVDDSDFRRDFAWKPTLGLEDGLRLMAADYARRMREG